MFTKPRYSWLELMLCVAGGVFLAPYMEVWLFSEFVADWVLPAIIMVVWMAALWKLLRWLDRRFP